METDECGRTADDSLRLEDGVELLGKYRGSGLQEAPYLIRRPDGQVVQVSRLIFLVAAGLDAARHADPATRRPDEIAGRVSLRFGQDVSPENVAYLIDRKLRPAGLVAPNAPADGAVAPQVRANPLLSLRLRLPVVPERLHRVASAACTPLFRPPVVAAAVGGLAVVDAWLALGHRAELVEAVRHIIYQPQLLLVITLLTILAALFHEIGHAAAARYGGATPGAMGAGIYLVWPVFYTDLTDAYRLDRVGRLRTDLGGVYFNILFTLAMTALYLETGFQPLLVFLVVGQLETLRQFLPFVRLDGYYVVSDLAGVPNLFAYMQPVLVSLLRRGDGPTRRAAQAKLAELNPRARAIITGWVCLTAPVLLVNAVAFLLLAPRLAGAAWGSAGGQLHEITTGGRVDLVGVVNAVVGLALLALPIVGMSYVFGRLLLRLAAAVPAWWQARPLATATVGLVTATLVAVQVAVEWPHTFASALERAQVAQAIEEARDEARADGSAVALAPPAEPIRVEAAPTTTAPTPTTAEPPTSVAGVGDTPIGTVPGSPDASAVEWRSSSGPETTTSTPPAPDPAALPSGGSTTTEPPPVSEPTGPAVPRNNGAGRGNGQTPAPSTSSSTTTTTTVPDQLLDERLEVLDRVLDLLF